MSRQHQPPPPPAPRTRGGTAHDSKRVQTDSIRVVLEILGDDVWFYADKTGNRCGKLGEAFKQMQDRLGYHHLPYKTFYNWFQWYLQHGETPIETTKRKQSLGKRKGHKAARRTTFEPEDDATLKAIYEKNPQLYLDEIQLLMERKRGRYWSASTLWRRMKHLGYSLQVAVFKARQRSEAKRAQYEERLRLCLKNPEMAIYIDETHKSANAARRRRAWGNVGQQPVVESYFEEDFRKRYTLIGAADINGFVVPACKIVEREHDRNDRDPDRGTVNMERFESYVKECLVPVLGKFRLCEPRSLVIMDNASIHLSDHVRKLIEDTGAVLIYTAPYSPDLNPIEFFFSVYKAGLKRYSNQGHNWQVAHHLAMGDVTPQKAANFFRKAKVPGCGKADDSDDDSDLDYMMCMGMAALAAAVLITQT